MKIEIDVNGHPVSFNNLLKKLLRIAAKGERDDEDNLPGDYYKVTEIISKHRENDKCSFKPGDWVTPKADSDLRRPGEPALVVAMYDDPQFYIEDLEYELDKYDMVILRCSFDDINEVNYYAEDSKNWEFYTGLVYREGEEKTDKTKEDK